MRSSKSILGFVAVLGLGACLHSDPRPSQGGPADEASADASSHVALAQVDPTWREDRYSLKGEFLLEVGSASRSTIQLNGELSLAKTSGDVDRRRFQFRQATAVATHQDSEAWRADRESLESPFFVDYDVHGLATHIWIKADTQNQLRKLFEVVAGELQIFRTDPQAAHWDSSERDNTGQYRASYTRGADGKLEKHKTAYTSVLPSLNGKATPPQIAKSELSFELGTRGDLVQASIREVIDTTSADARSGISLDLRNHSVFKPEAADAPGPSEPQFVRYELGKASEVTAVERDRALTAGLNLDRLEQLLQKDPKAAERSGLRQRLAAMLRLDPTLARQVEPKLHSAPEVAADLVGALVLAGNAEAQASLAHVLKDATLPEKLREHAAIFSAQVQEPNDTLLEAAWTDFRKSDSPTREVSGYACGAMLYALRERPTELAKRIIADVVSLGTAAANTTERIIVLGVLGNAGTTAATPLITRTLEVGSPAERAQAVRALRRIQTAESKALIRRGLRDANPSVRSAALESVRTMGAQEFVEALQTAVARETGESARLEIVGLLGGCKFSPALSKTLERLALHDPSEQVRTRASRLRAAAIGKETSHKLTDRDG